MRLLVCGGRNFAKEFVDINPVNRKKSPERLQYEREYYFVSNEICKALNWFPTEDIDTWLPPEGTVIISGGATGVDQAAIDWAVIHWVPFKEFKADWDKYGKAAGPIRNQQMLDEGKPDKVLAINGGRGTADMVRRARKAGIEVIEVKCF